MNPKIERFSPEITLEVIHGKRQRELTAGFNPTERELLAAVIANGRYAVCEETCLRLIASQIGCSVRTLNRILRRIVEKFEKILGFKAFQIRARRGFTSAYYFTRQFLAKIEGAIKARKQGQASQPIRHRQTVAPSRPTWATNAEFDDFRKRLREVANLIGIPLPKPSTP